LTALLLAVVSIGSAQSKKKAVTVAPDAVVKNLYATHDAGKSPFFQSKNRALVDRFFNKDLADLIWKDALCQQKEGGICNLDFNVPYATNGGDRQDASQFKIGKPDYGEGNRELADVPVTFKLFNTKESPSETITVLYRLIQSKAKDWKISDIYFPSNTESSNSLRDILTGAGNDSEDGKIRGKLQVGKTGSVILYFGEESGDYAGYCFKNDSEVARAILAQCKNGEQCEIVGESDGAMQCKVPGLEANLSDSGNIIKVTSVKSLGRKK